MYQRSRHTAWRQIAGETVLLDLEKKKMYGLNPTTGFVWQSLETAADLDGMLAALAAGDATPALGRGDLEAFLAELLELGLVHEGDALEDRSEDRPKDRPETATELPEALEPPCILWREEVEQIAGTCAFLPAMNPLCTQVPFA